MHSEHEPHHEGTPLEDGLRRYGRTVYSMAKEREETYTSRFIHLCLSAENDLLAESDLSEANRSQMIQDLFPSEEQRLPFEENLASLQLVPIRLMGNASVPIERLTPKAIEIALDTAVKADGGLHIECIDGNTSLICSTRQMCPARACAEEGVKLLHVLVVQSYLNELGTLDHTRATKNIDALKLALSRLGLFAATEVDLLQDAIAEGMSRWEAKLLSGVEGLETPTESD